MFCLFITAELAKEKPSTLFAVNTSAIRTIEPDASDHVIAREYERAESSGVGGVLKAPRATVPTPELTVAAYVFKTNATPVWLKAHRRASAAHQGSD